MTAHTNSAPGDLISTLPSSADPLRRRLDRVRTISVALVAGLSDADVSVQSMPDASPSKWHLAHTTWFFETFLLRDFVRHYRPFNAAFPFLFNSYYESEGARIARPSRGMLTRPPLDEMLSYRRHVDDAMKQALDDLPAPARPSSCSGVITRSSIRNSFLPTSFICSPRTPSFQRPLRMAPFAGATRTPDALGRGSPRSDRYRARRPGFAFDCEGPRHTVWLRRTCSEPPGYQWRMAGVHR